MDDTTKQFSKAVPAKDANLVLGVDRQLIEEFLTLILDNYRKADQAAAFLEHRLGVSNVHAISNLRDVLSHLCSMLDPATPADRKRDQLNNAEEHLRRAIIEPYNVGFSKLTEQFVEVYQKYRQVVEPVMERYQSLQSGPSIAMVDGRLKEIYELAKKGRNAKGRNLWTLEWEVGIASFVDAFDKLSLLKTEIEGYCFRYESIQKDEAATSTLAKLNANYEVALNRVAELERTLKSQEKEKSKANLPE